MALYLTVFCTYHALIHVTNEINKLIMDNVPFSVCEKT